MKTPPLATSATPDLTIGNPADAPIEPSVSAPAEEAAVVPQIWFESSIAQFDYFDVVDLDDIYERRTGKGVKPWQPHRVTFHTLIYFTEGSGTHQVDFERLPVTAGTVVFVNINQVHAFDEQHRPQGKLLIFTQEFMELLRSHIRLSTVGVGYAVFPPTNSLLLPEALQQSVANTFNELAAMDKQQKFAAELLQLLFSTLLVRLHQQEQQVTNRPLSHQSRQKFYRFMSLVEETFKTNRDAVDYAKKLGMSYKSLNEICRASVQDTPKRIIDAHTILEAKRCLAIDRLQTTQVAYDFSFGEVSNFVKYFKKHTGLTPAQFQKQSLS